jgi:RNA polymerase sigma-70 factor (ECF subfamily)
LANIHLFWFEREVKGRESNFFRETIMTSGQGNSVGDLMDQDAGPSPAPEPADGELLERFVSRRDESAFTALVHRHGPMVLGVCRRVLNDWQSAEDAFQVTFLVLARKADSLMRPGLLANWLHGVAYRTALKARSRAVRQGVHERQAAAMAPTESRAGRSVVELREVLDEELSHLPEKYRAPLVLCYLEGKTNEEAARLLHWPLGSMSARLARAGAAAGRADPAWSGIRPPLLRPLPGTV